MAQEKQTFAFNVAQPVQAPIPGGSPYRGAGGLEGGQTSGGDRSGVQDTRGQALGSFLDGLLEPWAQRKAKENFAKGVTDQMFTDAENEIRTGKGLLPQIFGQSAYEEGATFYAAQERIATAQAEWSADEDRLKRLSREDVAKEWATRLETAKVGDPYLDRAIEDGLMSASAPMLQSVAKARYKYGQEQANLAQGKAWAASGDAFQAVAESFASTTSPSEQDVAGYAVAAQNFIQGFAPVLGQEDDAFKKNMQNAIRGFASSGKGHAASMLLRSGVLDVFDEAERSKLEDLYDKYGKAAIAKASGTVQNKILQLDYDVEWGNKTPAEAIAAKQAINEELKRATGFDVDYYDTEDVAGTGRNVIKEVKRQAERAEDMQARIADREDQQAHEKEMELAKAQVDAGIAAAALASDNPYESLAKSGGKMEVLQQAVYSSYIGNDFAAVGRAFRSGVPANSGIKDSIQNTILSQVSEFNPKEFKGVADKFQGMMQANPALAKEYFGNAFGRMRSYQAALQTGASPSVAFNIAFGGSDGQYQPSGQQVATANKDLKTAITSKVQPAWYQRLFGASTLNKSGISAVSNAAARTIAELRLGGAGDLSDETLQQMALESNKANGVTENYGPFAWSNDKGTAPIWRSMGVPQDLAERVIVEQIDVSLKNRGYAAGKDGAEYKIQRTMVDGQPAIQVVPVDEEGNIKFNMAAVITAGQLKTAAMNKVSGIRQSNQGGWEPTRTKKSRGTGIDRYVAGETSMDRIKRINKETKEASGTGTKQDLAPALRTVAAAAIPVINPVAAIKAAPSLANAALTAARAQARRKRAKPK